MVDLKTYIEACNYPGVINPAAVRISLQKYCTSLGIKRDVVQIERGWKIDDYHDLKENVLKIARAARDAMAAMAAMDARDAMDARAAMAAMAARDAMAEMAARDARDARDAMDAMDAILLRELGSWILLARGWGWYNWDLSWIVTTYFGALQNKSDAVARWSKPLFEAHCSGAWYLIWTPDYLFWVRHPIVKVEIGSFGRRLHCEDGPACGNSVQNLYFWHGIMVPAYAVIEPTWITLAEIEAEKNEEVRRVLIERFGWPRYIAETDATCLDSRRDDVDGTTQALMSLKDGSTRLLCACRSTGRVYAVGVDRKIKTCIEAQNWMAGGSFAGRKLNLIGAS